VTDASARVDELIEGILAGNRRRIGRAISLIERDLPEVEALVRGLYPHTGNAYTIGITGPPGSGKSTLVDELIRVIRESGLSVGIIAVDPNSPFSGGAILGDRIRMMRHSSDTGVYIRSMGARGHLGGLALATDNTVDVLDAMGMNIVLLETVGVGQSELEVADSADTSVVVIPPGMGDGVQAIKAGIMEIADIFVVNKADHPQADRTVSDLQDLMRMGPRSRDWVPPVVKSVAIRNEGVEDLWIRIKQHRVYLERSGRLEARRRARLEHEVVDIAARKLRERVLQPRVDSAAFQELLSRAAERRIDPYEAAEQILAQTGT
jgi:LAO/AO transport system kinase